MMVLLCTGHGSAGNAAGVQIAVLGRLIQATFSAETAFLTVEPGRALPRAANV